MKLNDLPVLFDQKQTVVAVEAPITERIKILEFLHKLADNRNLPLYFWNQGYTKLQKVNKSIQLIPVDIECKSGLDWLLQNQNAPGIFILEGAISPDTVTGVFPSKTAVMLRNFVYELAATNR
ncbi:MAG: hypothetical protein QNJ47_18475 [Nostocaceae cyanobacterium]|nr:hypothetical protein [Nostocaceae cyanobacterium]